MLTGLSLGCMGGSSSSSYSSGRPQLAKEVGLLGAPATDGLERLDGSVIDRDPPEGGVIIVTQAERRDDG